jgi:hypothetical protein
MKEQKYSNNWRLNNMLNDQWGHRRNEGENQKVSGI